MRFHILGLAHVPTSKQYSSCAYTQKVVNMTKMLTDLGHEAILYCGEGSETSATEQVTVVSDKLRKEVYGDYDWKSTFFKHDPTDLVHRAFNQNAIEAINERKRPHDFLLCPMGNYDKPIADAVGLMTVESGIGYTGVFSNHRVFESYAWMHYIYGLLNQPDGSWYDCVIPNSYDINDFKPTAIGSKDDYYLYMGRLISRKGIKVAVEVTRHLGKRLVIAGQGDLSNVDGEDFSLEKHVEFVGTVSGQARTDLFARAIATFTPTYYIGPFEGVAVESQLCGTPVLTTDWGVYSETVKHGQAGYRCRTFDDFVWAAQNTHFLSASYIRSIAIENYSIDRVKHMYNEYFFKLDDLWNGGWYELHEDRTDLDWLRKV